MFFGGNRIFIKFRNVKTEYKETINRNYFLVSLFMNSETKNEQKVFGLLPFTNAYEWNPETRCLSVILSDTYDVDKKNKNVSYNWIDVTLAKGCEMETFFNNINFAN